MDPSDRDEVENLMHNVVAEEFDRQYDKLLNEFENVNKRSPNARETDRLEKSAEVLTVEEIEHEVQQEKVDYRGMGHDTTNTPIPRGRGRRFLREEAQALAQQPPPPLNDVAALITDFSESSHEALPPRSPPRASAASHPIPR